MNKQLLTLEEAVKLAEKVEDWKKKEYYYQFTKFPRIIYKGKIDLRKKNKTIISIKKSTSLLREIPVIIDYLLTIKFNETRTLYSREMSEYPGIGNPNCIYEEFKMVNSLFNKIHNKYETKLWNDKISKDKELQEIKNLLK